MSQVLGIDIGSYSIKLAILTLKKAHVNLKDVIEIPVPLREHEDEVKSAKIQAIRQSLATVNLSDIRDNIYTGLGSQHAVIQNFEFLKVSKKYLSKIIENEFDETGLFNLNDYLIEHSIIKRKAKQTNVLGILVKKRAAKDLIEILDETNLKCRTVDLNCLALQNLISYLPEHHFTGDDAIPINFIIDIGHQKTSVVVLENDQVVLERSFNLAGHYITKKIQEACQVSYEEAKELKHKVSSAVEFQSDQSKIAKKTLIECCREICKEIERFILSINQDEEKKVHSILLTGGTSRFAELAQIIEQALGIKTKNMSFTDEIFSNNSEIEHVYETFGQAIALALRGTGARSNSKINLRHGELALSSDYENLISQIFTAIKITSILLVCFLGTYYLRKYLYQNKINQIKTLFNNQVISYFNTEPLELRAISSKADWNFESYSSKAWDIIEQNYKQKAKFINQTSSQESMIPFVILSEISAAIPKDLYFEVSLYNFKDGVLSLQAVTNSKESVNDIMNRISQIKLLSNVQKKSEAPKPGSDDKLIIFSVLATLNSEEGI